MFRYVDITIYNIEYATEIQMNIFPNESAYEHYKYAIKSNLEYVKYYLVYKNNDVVGITGIYCNEDIKEAEKIMANEQIRRLPIVDTDNNNKVIGMLTLGDLASNKTTNTQEFCNTIENICNHNTKNCE